jgi:uncharacterized membrane protein YbjE (DUF340 family)
MAYIILSVFIGIILGSFLKLSDKQKKLNGKLQMIGLIALLFSMGVSMGSNDKIIGSLGEIGIKALVLALLASLFSVFAIFVINKMLNKRGVR